MRSTAGPLIASRCSRGRALKSSVEASSAPGRARVDPLGEHLHDHRLRRAPACAVAIARQELVVQLLAGLLELVERLAGEAATGVEEPQERGGALGDRVDHVLAAGNLAREVVEQVLGQIALRPAPEAAVAVAALPLQHRRRHEVAVLTHDATGRGALPWRAARARRAALPSRGESLPRRLLRRRSAPRRRRRPTALAAPAVGGRWDRRSARATRSAAPARPRPGARSPHRPRGVPRRRPAPPTRRARSAAALIRRRRHAAGHVLRRPAPAA